jgi:uncharacterized membrane protein YccC
MPATPPRHRPQHDSNPARDFVVNAARDWLGSEGERWMFVGKTLLAALCALWLAFRLDLESPVTAVATVFVLAQPSSGMVLEKSFHRLLGTLIGCASALALIGLFPQQPLGLFLGLSLWVGLCTSGAALFRNAQSYSFVLAGYTACMIVVPALEAPPRALALAIARVSEVGLAVICSAVINDALFPRHHGAHVKRTVQTRYARFVGFCHDVLAHRLAPAKAELMQLQFAADIAALESGRAAAYYEANHARADSRLLHAFNAAFMSALTTFYTWHRLLHRLREPAAPATPVITLLEPLHALLGAALESGAGHAALEALQAQLPARVAAARADLMRGAPSRREQINFDTAAELLLRFAANMHAFQALYLGLARQTRQLASDPQTYTPKTPRAIVLASGARAAATVALLAWAWYHLAWPYAGMTLVMATIFCALASSSPRPGRMMRQILLGFLSAWPLTFFCLYFVLPQASGYPMLALGVAPLLAGGLYLASDPRRAGIGIGIIMFSSQVLAPANLMRIDGADYLNFTLALVIGVMVAAAIFALLLPEHTMGHKDHVAAALWREARRTCVAAPRHLRHRFDSRVRDLLSQLNAAAGPTPDAATRAVVRQALTLLELGHSVIALRALLAPAAPAALPGPARAGLLKAIAGVAAYLDAPGAASCADALAKVRATGPALRRAGPGLAGADVRGALAELHSIYTALLDQPFAPAGADHGA